MLHRCIPENRRTELFDKQSLDLVAAAVRSALHIGHNRYRKRRYIDFFEDFGKTFTGRIHQARHLEGKPITEEELRYLEAVFGNDPIYHRAEQERWPLVYRVGEYEVYGNPACGYQAAAKQSMIIRMPALLPL